MQKFAFRTTIALSMMLRVLSNKLMYESEKPVTITFPFASSSMLPRSPVCLPQNNRAVTTDDTIDHVDLIDLTQTKFAYHNNLKMMTP